MAEEKDTRREQSRPTDNYPHSQGHDSAKESTIQRFGLLLYGVNHGNFNKWREALIKINEKDARSYNQHEFQAIQKEFKQLVAQDSAKYNEKI